MKLIKSITALGAALTIGFILALGVAGTAAAASQPTVDVLAGSYNQQYLTVAADSGVITTSTGTYQSPTGGASITYIKGRRSYIATGAAFTGPGTITILTPANPSCGSSVTLYQDGVAFYTTPLTSPCVTQVYASATRTGNTVTFTNPTSIPQTVVFGYADPSPSLTFTGATVSYVTKVFSGTAGHKSVSYVYVITVTLPSGQTATAVAA